MSTEATATPEETSATGGFDPIVQYVIVRKDLFTEQGWPLGPIIAQACHASSAAIWSSREDPTTAEYCAPENINNMHKVVLEVKAEAQLSALAAKLTESGVVHKLWVEQPENYPTCLATKPYRKSDVAQHFKKFQLCRAPIGAPATKSI